MKEKVFSILEKTWPYLLVGIIIYFPVFGHLGKLPLRMWDEARLAQNALEMYHNGNYLMTFIDGNPDMWNTKPPLLIWIQVGFFKLLGPSDMAARLPSAISAFVTAMFLMAMVMKHFKSEVMAIATALTLITIPGYMTMHGARSADYDAFLTLTVVLYCFAFFHYCQTSKPKYLYYFFGFLLMGIMSKSIAAFLVLPALGIYALWDKKVLEILKSKHFYIGFLSVFAIVFAYYFTREQVNPGYWEAVQMNELGGRFSNTLEDNKGSFLWYYDFLVSDHLGYWTYLLPVAILLGLSINNSTTQRFMGFIFLICVVHFLVVSSAETKLEWYNIPLFPFFALFLGFLIFQIVEFAQSIPWTLKNYTRTTLQISLLFLILIRPVQSMIATNYHPVDDGWEFTLYEIGRYLKGCLKGDEELYANRLVVEGYQVQNMFYVDCIADKGTDLKMIYKEQVVVGDRIAVFLPEVKEYLFLHFELEKISQYGGIESFKVLSKKEPW